MAESVHNEPTSLQFRLLLRRVKALEDPIAKARILNIARLQGQRRSAEPDIFPVKRRDG